MDRERSQPRGPAGIPDGLGDVWFASGDGSSVAFGRLGGDTQRTLPLPGSQVGAAGGDHVAIARAAEDGTTVLELWSMPDATPTATIATIVDGRVSSAAGSTATHEQVFYGVVDGPGRRGVATGRVRRDGRHARREVGAGPALRPGRCSRIDDALFVAQWCPLVGSCERAIYDAATGAARAGGAARAIPSCGLDGLAARSSCSGRPPTATCPPASSRRTSGAARSATLHDGFGERPDGGRPGRATRHRRRRADETTRP